jgi:quinol monooxygenase YgiN
VIAMAWQFELTEGGQEQFERFYGADGPWTALSRRSRSYLGSSFLRDQVQPTRYLLIEYWSEMVVYEKHHADFSNQVAALEATRDKMCLSVTPLGVFTALDIPSRTGPTWSRRDGV